MLRVATHTGIIGCPRVATNAVVAAWKAAENEAPASINTMSAMLIHFALSGTPARAEEEE